MRLTVLGSSGTYPTAGRPASGYLVRADVDLVLDLGPGTFPVLLERGVTPDAIVLSHRHGDHCLDLLPLFNHLRFDRPDVRRIPLLAPRGVVECLASFIGAGPDHAFFEVFAPEVVAPGNSIRFGDLVLTFGAAAHPVPAVCVAVTDGTKALVYSGDTGPGGDLATLAGDADVLLCEATHQGEPPPDRFPFHLHAVEAGELAARAGVGRLIVTHVAPTLDPSVSVAEAAGRFEGPVVHAIPGMEVEV
ncbi:MAG: MBL fold metallo-hydrolase [Acidimicrobiia bacterium]